MEDHELTPAVRERLAKELTASKQEALELIETLGMRDAIAKTLGDVANILPNIEWGKRHIVADVLRQKAFPGNQEFVAEEIAKVYDGLINRIRNVSKGTEDQKPSGPKLELKLRPR